MSDRPTCSSRLRRITPLIFLTPVCTFLSLVLMLQAESSPPRRSTAGTLTQDQLSPVELAVAAGDRDWIRRHAWRVLESVVGSEDLPTLATWEKSWASRESLVDDKFLQPSSLGPSRQLGLEMRKDFIKTYTDTDRRNSGRTAFSLLTEIRYNHVAAEMIEDLKKDVADWESKRRGCVGGCKIPGFPREAITLKAVWWPIKAREDVSIVPVWDGSPSTCPEFGITHQQHQPGRGTKRFGNDFTSWQRLVAVTPKSNSNSGCEVREMPLQPWACDGKAGCTQFMRVVSLNDFYWRHLSDADVKNKYVQAAFKEVWGREYIATEKDRIVLVGLHIATKELKEWLWITLWWHDNADVGPFAQHRPIRQNHRWRNYLMDVTFLNDREPQQDPAERAIFNPWLEAPLSNGTKSNCIACHQRAAWRSETPWMLDTSTGFIPDGSSIYNDRIRLDYIWSLSDLKPDQRGQ